jgi:hypothetical protein
MSTERSVYDEESDRLSNEPKPGGGGGGGGDFYTPKKPANIGQRIPNRLRVIQRMHEDAQGNVVQPVTPYPEFWVKVHQHRIPNYGQQKVYRPVCPDYEIHQHDDWRTKMTCPLCLLQQELWEARNPEWKNTMEMLRWEKRTYCNVIDLDEPASHWKEDGKGGYLIRPKIWEYSNSLHKDLIALCRNLGPIEDWSIGRDLILEAERTGKDQWDIEYRIQALDKAPLDQRLMPVFVQAYSLERRRQPESYEKLREAAQKLDPRGASRSQTGYGGGGGYQQPYQQQPPAQQGYSAPPPGPTMPPAPPAAPPGQPARVFHYTGPGGQRQASAGEIAQMALAQPGAQHHAWAEGMAGWADVQTVPEIASEIARLRQPAAPPVPAAPPAPPPMPAAPPPPAAAPPVHAGGSAGYAPQGGYAVQAPAAGGYPAAPPPAAYPPGPPAASPMGPPPPAPPAPPGPPMGNGAPPGPPGPPSGRAWG